MTMDTGNSVGIDHGGGGEGWVEAGEGGNVGPL